MVHSVDEVDVGDPPRTKHHVRPLRPPFRRMAGLILWPHIRFDLNDLACKSTTIDYPNEILADERSRNRDRWAIEISARENVSSR